MTTTQLIAEISARLAAATPGPWEFTPADDADDWMIYNAEFTFVKQDDSGVPVSREDGDLIAHAPTDLAKLLAIVEVYEAALREIEHARCAWQLSQSIASTALEAADKLAGGE